MAALGTLDMVKAGQYEMGHSAFYYWKGKDPNFRTTDIYYGVMPFIVLQMIVLAILVLFPQLFGLSAR